MKKNHSARFVYEFDAADMAKNYLYPAMAVVSGQPEYS
jgi:hypothetical protein